VLLSDGPRSNTSSLFCRFSYNFLEGRKVPHTTSDQLAFARIEHRIGLVKLIKVSRKKA
jgi:hypothetical protein